MQTNQLERGRWGLNCRLVGRAMHSASVDKRWEKKVRESNSSGAGSCGAVALSGLAPSLLLFHIQPHKEAPGLVGEAEKVKVEMQNA